MRRLGEATFAAGIAGAARPVAGIVRRAPPGVPPEAAFLLGLVPDDQESWIPSSPQYLDLHEWSSRPHQGRGMLRWMAERDIGTKPSAEDVEKEMRAAEALVAAQNAKLSEDWRDLLRAYGRMDRARGAFPKPVRDSLMASLGGIDRLVSRNNDLRGSLAASLRRMQPRPAAG
jgi:hypothetical protein